MRHVGIILVRQRYLLPGNQLGACLVWPVSLEDGSWRMEVGSWRLEGGGWKVEVGRWRLEGGGWKMEVGSWRLEAGGWKMEVGRLKIEDRNGGGAQPGWVGFDQENQVTKPQRIQFPLCCGNCARNASKCIFHIMKCYFYF
jgi:hypothetical protein